MTKQRQRSVALLLQCVLHCVWQCAVEYVAACGSACCGAWQCMLQGVSVALSAWLNSVNVPSLCCCCVCCTACCSACFSVRCSARYSVLQGVRSACPRDSMPLASRRSSVAVYWSICCSALHFVSVFCSVSQCVVLSVSSLRRCNAWAHSS